MSLDSVNVGTQSSWQPAPTDAINANGSVDTGGINAVSDDPAVALASGNPQDDTPFDNFTNLATPLLPHDVQKSQLLAQAAPDSVGGTTASNQSLLARTTPPTYSTGASANTDARYTTGDPKRPDIRHDNGFLQNPNDPADTKPIATTSPSWDDRKAYAKQLLKADAALAAVELGVPKWLTPDQYEKYLELPDGIRAYHHFLTGGGADSSFSYDKFVKDDASGKVVLNNAIGDTQRGAEDIYQQMIAKDPSLANKPVTFKITGSQIGVGSSGNYPYPATENWQKAIGAHSIWNSATVTVKPPSTPGGKPTFEMKFTLHGEDRYNFNPGAKDIATGQPDSDNGRFERVGLAHQYMNYGSLSRDVSWTSGDIASSTSVKGGPR